MMTTKGFEHNNNGNLIYNLSYWSRKIDKKLENADVTCTGELQMILFNVKRNERLKNYQELYNIIISKIKNFVGAIEVDINNKNKYISVIEKKFKDVLLYEVVILRKLLEKNTLDLNEKFIIENIKLLDYSDYWS